MNWILATEDILKCIRLFRASLWSDAALLYRRETGWDVEKSAMAVVIQESLAGERSGVVFTRNPNDESQAADRSTRRAGDCEGQSPGNSGTR